MFNSEEAREKLDELVANCLNDREFIDLFKNLEVRCEGKREGIFKN